MKRIFHISLIALLLVIGCSNGSIVNIKPPNNVEEVVFKKFIGVPMLLSMEGSYVALNNEWVLTAKHNRLLFIGYEFIGHPECDVALVRINSELRVGTDNIYTEQASYFSGYPIGSGFTSTAGYYVGDITVPGEDCAYSAATNHVSSGMSGGAVTNANGDLVGIIIGFQRGMIEWEDGRSHNRPSVFISINYIQDWIDSVIK